MAWVSEFFFTKNPNLKRGEKNIFFCFLCWGRGEGLVVVVIDFFTKNRNLHNLFFSGGWGWNGRGSVARGSVARVNEFFLQIIQI